jgi:hypothetical protein
MAEHKPRINNFLILLCTATLIKLSLFAFVCFYSPQNTINTPASGHGYLTEADSHGYLILADAIRHDGVFASKDDHGKLQYESFRTPGYPLFLAFFHGILNIPFWGIILIQICLSLAAAMIVYKTAGEIEPRIASLAMAIMLFDISIMVHSLVILTETLFLFFIALYMFVFFRYLKNRRLGMLICSAIIAAVLAYIRPVALYLGLAAGIFILYSGIHTGTKKTFIHAGIFLAIAYGLIGLWFVRNWYHLHTIGFSTILDVNSDEHFMLLKSYAWHKESDPQWYSPFFYYVKTTANGLLNLLARPGSLKYLRYPPINIIGKIFGYPWMIFWLTGFFAGIFHSKKNIYLQSMLWVVAYLITATLIGAVTVSGERLRLPMLPFIAVIAAFGWSTLYGCFTPFLNFIHRRSPGRV